MKRTLAALAAVTLAFAAAATPALAEGDKPQSDGIDVFHTWLKPIPHDPQKDGGSETHGSAIVLRTNEQVIVLMFVKGSAANLPHAQHLHGVGEDRCPGPEADVDHNGVITTPEGVPAYGSIQASLTTTGDASPASGLAVPRFPVAMQNGWYMYVRAFAIGTDIPQAVADNLDLKHVVVHGIDTNNNGEYDFDAGPSPLDPTLPLEATVPAACGELTPLPWTWWWS